MSKEEMIKNGQDVSLDDGNVIVLNGVSIAEKDEEKKEPETEVAVEEQTAPEESEEKTAEEPVPTEVAEAPAEEPTSPEIPVEIPVAVEETPQIPIAPIDLSGINTLESDSASAEDTTVYPQIPSEQPNIVSNPFGTNVENNDAPDYDTNSGFNQNYNTPTFDGFMPTQNESFNNFENSDNLNGDFNSNLEGSVFKTANDVDASFEKIMADVRTSYEENISGPTKTLVEFVNRFIRWGNEVTANGLNRRLFDEYDELIALLKDQKSYDNVDVNLGYNSPSIPNFGDDQINNGGMGMGA